MLKIETLKKEHDRSGFERVITVSEHLGIIGFFVDAKDNDAKAYYEQFGFRLKR